LKWTSIVSQNLVNEVRFGANRVNFPLTCQGVSTFDTFGPTDTFGHGVDYSYRSSRDLAASCSTAEMDRNDSAAPTRAATI